MKERRRHGRYRIPIDTAYMKVQGHGSIRSTTMTEDIGLGGMSAKMTRMVKRGDELLMELTSASGQILLVLVRVRWVLKGRKAADNLCGLRFEWISSKSLLAEYISSTADTIAA